MKRLPSSSSEKSFTGGANLKPPSSERSEWERIACGRHSGDVSPLVFSLEFEWRLTDASGSLAAPV